MTSNVVSLRKEQPSTHTIATAAAALVRNGYSVVPIKPGTKRPDLINWTKIEIDEHTVEDWKSTGRGGHGIGIRCDLTPGIDLDISDESVLGDLLDWCDAALGVTCRRTGRPPRVLLPYRCDAPFPKISSAKYESPDGNTHQIEILGKGNQFVAFAIHPDTNKPYAWEGGDPLNVSAADLPTLTPEMGWKLIAHFESIVPATWKCVSKASVPSTAEHKGNPKKTADLRRLRSAFEVIPNEDRDWSSWKEKFMLALWSAVGEQKAEGFAIIDEWSSKHPKYDPERTLAEWEGITGIHSIGAGTIFYEAYINGWIDPGEDTSDDLGVVEDMGDELLTSSTAHSGPAPVIDVEPADLWAKFDPPVLPSGLLPSTIEAFAHDEARVMGADPAGVAMAALATCAAAIPDSVKLQVKEHHAGWLEAARLWVLLVGAPSTMKSPILRTATRPLRSIDNALVKNFIHEKMRYEALPKEERKSVREPIQKRVVIEDVTVEAAADVLKDNAEGVLCFQDEISGWLGSMDKYSGGRGSHKDRAVWLQAFNGGPYSVNRMSRVTFTPNLSVSLLGGVQPDAIRKAAAEGVDDGLIQRFFPVMLRPATLGTDEPPTKSTRDYETLVQSLRHLAEPLDEEAEGDDIDASPNRSALRFSSAAQAVRKKFEVYIHDMNVVEDMNPKLASHFEKTKGLFARLCLTWHCIEHASDAVLPSIVDEDVASRVYRFLTTFLLKHSISFYMSTLDFTEQEDVVLACAGYILAHPEKTELRARDFLRGDSKMKGLLTTADRERTLEKLEYLGWVFGKANKKERANPSWIVNAKVHERFAEHAANEKSRREKIRKAMSELRQEEAAA